MEPILPGLPVEIVGSMIDRSFDFIAGQVGQSLDWKEWKQKNHLTGDQNNFLDVYVEAVVAFSKAEKPKFLKHFFKEQSVVDALYQHWYKNPGSLFYTSLKGLSAHFQIQQQLAEHSLEAEKEIAFFEKCFREAGNYSRTVGEREDSERLKSVAEKMDKLSPSNSKPPRDLNHLPFITIEKQAIGRDEDVDELHHLLQNNQSVSVVRGIGGMGKTTLVKAYLTRYHKNYDHIAWIGEADKLIISVSNDLQLQNRLGLIFGTELPAERFLAVMDALNALNGSNLLILDNANATLSTETLGGRPLNQFLPGSAWKKIATSREHIASMQDFKLDALEFDAAARLFRTYYKETVSDEFLKGLFELIGSHTLTIELIAKTLTNSRGRLNPEQVTEKYKSRQLDDKELQRRIELDHPGDNSGIFLHLVQTFDFAKLTEPETKALQIFLLLPPEGELSGTGHPVDFFENWLGEGTDDFLSTLDTLCDRGWLQRDEADCYSLHRLLRDVLRYRLLPSLEEAESFISHTISILQWDISTNYPLLFPKIPFGEAILEMYPDSEAAIISELQNQLAIVIKEAGFYTRAAELLELALKSDLKNFGSEHPKVAVSQSNLALVYKNLGRYNEAAQLLELALKSDLKNFGSEHPTVAVRQSNLALVYSELGRYNEAAQLLELALKSDLKNFGSEHPKVAVRQSNLALVYSELGRYNEAAQLLELALKSDLKNFGSDHLSVAVSQSNLANVYSELGRYNEAAQLLELALKSDLKNFGSDHLSVARSKNNLAHVYIAQKQWNKALPLFEQAYTIFKNWLGEDHPNTKIVAKNLIYTRERMGKE